MKVVLVEDDVGIRMSLKLLLEWEGHEVLGFECGERALEHLRKFSAELVLMDWHTGGMTGDAFLERLDDACLPLFRPRVGILSGDAVAARAVAQEWAEFFLMKPFDPAVLFEKIGISRQHCLALAS